MHAAIGQACFGDALGQGLHQPDMAGGDDPPHGIGQLLIIDHPRQLIATDCGEANTVAGFLRDLDAVAARALNRGRLH